MLDCVYVNKFTRFFLNWEVKDFTLNKNYIEYIILTYMCVLITTADIHI